MSKPSVSAIIPCLNEEQTLGICIAKIRQTFEDLGIDGEIVVGDNGSTDRSVEIAESMGAVVAHQPVKGYGSAIMAAVNSARSDRFIMADADDSYDWTNLKPFIDELDKGHDLVIGNRFRGVIHEGAMPFLHRYLGNPVLSRIPKLLYKIKVGDFHCGMRGFTREAWERMRLSCPGMEFATEMVIRASQEDMSISEIAIDLFPDKRDRAPHLRTFRDGWRHLRFIMMYAPNYLYLLPAFLLLLFGGGLQVLLFNGPVTLFGQYIGIHFLALGMMLFFLGMSIASMGIAARFYLVNSEMIKKDRFADWVNRFLSLDRIILIGALLFLTGMIVDVSLLFEWLNTTAPMTGSIHHVFIASGLIVTGVQLIFFAFFLELFRGRILSEKIRK